MLDTEVRYRDILVVSASLVALVYVMSCERSSCWLCFQVLLLDLWLDFWKEISEFRITMM